MADRRKVRLAKKYRGLVQAQIAIMYSCSTFGMRLCWHSTDLRRVSTEVKEPGWSLFLDTL